MPGAVSQAKALENISVGYAITYVFGTVGMILVARLFIFKRPAWLPSRSV